MVTKIMLIGPHDLNEQIRIPVKGIFDPEEWVRDMLDHPHYRFVEVKDDKPKVDVKKSSKSKKKSKKK